MLQILLQGRNPLSLFPEKEIPQQNTCGRTPSEHVPI
jgi:hypothetical protein